MMLRNATLPILQRRSAFFAATGHRNPSRSAVSSHTISACDGAIQRCGAASLSALLPTINSNQARSFHCTTAAAASSSSAVQQRRLGLGSTKWTRVGHQYAEIVGTALQNGVTTLEAGPEGGDQALCDAVRQYAAANNTVDEPLELLVRMGYRLQRPREPEEKVDGTLVDPPRPTEMGDVPPEDASSDPPEIHVFDSDVVQEAGGNEEFAVHNVSPEYLYHAVHNNPVVKLKGELGDEKIKLTVLIHNPEVQHGDDLPDKLAKAFGALEQMDEVDSYGVTSNGLCLPSDHPLHLDYQTVLAAAKAAQDQLVSKSSSSTKFRVMQLPANALETVGIDVAKQIQKENPSVDVYSMRPLTCFPDQGTGTGRPFVLADFQMPATMEKKLQWTNEMEHPPQAYEIALKTALQHFDAEPLLEKKQKEELSAEERETLDGCKLMQSVLHDLDVGLEKVRSFAAHEDTLYREVIPVIQDTFESYDENTAQVLQSFFGAYSLAVRYHVAKNTRHLLLHGERGSSSSSSSTYSEDELPATKRLQDFGLEFVLKQKCEDNTPAIDKVIVGCSQPIQVVSAVNVVKQFKDETELSS